MLSPKNTILLILLFVLGNGFSQTISGIVLDGVTEKPLEGASVFFQKTSIGTTTNSKGEFTIEHRKDLNTPLVISFMGYQISISEGSSFENRTKFYIYESSFVLDEVILDSNDNWSNELKLREFKKHFLGETLNGRSCKLLNEEDLRLRFNKKTKKLTARAIAPIYIRNKNLNYLILVELQHFEVSYKYVSKNKKNIDLDYVSYAGINYFQSLQKKSSSVIQKNREQAYLGSSLHFIRALSNSELNKEGFSIYSNNKKVNPKKYISVFPIGIKNSVKVQLRGKLYISYKEGEESSIESQVGTFFIDNYGNYSPVDKIRFTGNMGNQRMGDALPLDFMIETKNKSDL